MESVPTSTAAERKRTSPWEQGGVPGADVRTLRELLRQPPPADCGIVPGSSPIPAFGDHVRARVATLGINPSSAEFLGPHGLLTQNEQRLETYTTIGARDGEPLTDEQVGLVLGGCSRYFERNPYGKWFNPLDEVLRAGLGVSYFTGSSCHLDLVPWATDPKWSDLKPPIIRRRLLKHGTPYLLAALDESSVEVIIVNGAAVWKQLTDCKIVKAEDLGEMTVSRGRMSTTLRRGSGLGRSFVGWTLNLQGSFGITVDDRRQLADALASMAAAGLGGGCS